MAAQHDLTLKMIPFLDRQLVLPLLEFLKLNEIYETKDLVQAEQELMQDTDKSAEAKTKFDALKKEVEPVVELLGKLPENASNEERAAYLRKHKITEEQLNRVYEYGQAQFNFCKDYDETAMVLDHFRMATTNESASVSAVWGILAASILAGQWGHATKCIKSLRLIIDPRSQQEDSKSVKKPEEQKDVLFTLQQRAWLIHWSLFVFFNLDRNDNYNDGDNHNPKDSRHDIIDNMFFSPQYINTIQTLCPWLLRYMVVAVVIYRRKKNQMKELVKIIEQETYQYRDPATEFIEALYIHFDLEEAQKKLKECEDVLENDFFLKPLRDEFVENARESISETYCRIHQKINIKDMSKTLNLNEEEGEKWIVKLIQGTRQDAKIDFEENTVIMNTPVTSVYQQVIERTKGLPSRSQEIERYINERTKNTQSRPQNTSSRVK